MDASDEAGVIEQISELKAVFKKAASADVPSEVHSSLSLSIYLFENKRRKMHHTNIWKTRSFFHLL